VLIEYDYVSTSLAVDPSLALGKALTISEVFSILSIRSARLLVLFCGEVLFGTKEMMCWITIEPPRFFPSLKRLPYVEDPCLTARVEESGVLFL